jgi:hypothetical protein
MKFHLEDIISYTKVKSEDRVCTSVFKRMFFVLEPEGRAEVFSFQDGVHVTIKMLTRLQEVGLRTRGTKGILLE